MSNVLHDSYWTSEFEITQADMQRLEEHIARSRVACTLSELTERIIRGRIVLDPEQSAPVTAGKQADVRILDLSAEWQPGDQVLVLTYLHRRNLRTLKTGEISAVTEEKIHIHVDDEARPFRSFNRHPAGSDQARKAYLAVENQIAQLRATEIAADDPEFLDLVLLEHGERVTGKLLQALSDDARFVRLEGRWFLRGLVQTPSADQMGALAWRLLQAAGPQPTAELLAWLGGNGDAQLFGLYLALREWSKIFANANPGQRPVWTLAGPPPGERAATHAAYDEETYEILCMPGETVGGAAKQRLWEQDLLAAVMA